VEGQHSLAVANSGNTTITSIALSSMGSVGQNVTVDVLQPANHPNPQWRGTVGLVLVSPSLGLSWQDLGTQSFPQNPLDAFLRFTFALPSSVRTKLSGSYSDLRVKVMLNVPQAAGPWLIDRLSFGGTPPGTAGAGGGSSTGGASGAGASSGSNGSGTAGTSGSAGSAGTIGSAGAPGGNGPCTFSSPTNSATTRKSLHIDVPRGIRPEEIAVGATSGALRVNDGVKVMNPLGGFASVSQVGTGSAWIGPQAELQNLHAALTDLRNDSKVHGLVRTSGTLGRQPGAVVEGGAFEHLVFQPYSVTNLDVDFPNNHRGSCNIEPDLVQRLDPGAYGNVSVKSRSRLELKPGKYFFQSLVLEPQSVLAVDNRDSIFVYIAQDFTFRGSIQETADVGNVLFGLLDARAFAIDAPFRGVVVAPRGSISLISSSVEGHIGAFFGKDVTLHQWTRIRHRPPRFDDICGDNHSCNAYCKCGSGEPGCRGDYDCRTGLVCHIGLGEQFGYGPGINICAAPNEPPPATWDGPEEFDQNSTTVGTLPGRSNVTADGSYTHSIPLWVPPGRLGMQPELSLEYHSPELRSEPSPANDPVLGWAILPSVHSSGSQTQGAPFWFHSYPARLVRHDDGGHQWGWTPRDPGTSRGRVSQR
jgi:hypothetical protein